MEAAQLLTGDAPALTVTTQQLKTFYLRGYTGSRYEAGRWLPLQKAAYAGKQEGMLAWLEAENFPVAAQAAAALMPSPSVTAASFHVLPFIFLLLLLL